MQVGIAPVAVAQIAKIGLTIVGKIFGGHVPLEQRVDYSLFADKGTLEKAYQDANILPKSKPVIIPISSQSTNLTANVPSENKNVDWKIPAIGGAILLLIALSGN